MRAAASREIDLAFRSETLSTDLPNASGGEWGRRYGEAEAG